MPSNQHTSEAFQNLLDNIGRYVPLAEEDVLALEEAVQPMHIRRKELIVEPGKICAAQTYVAKGAFRSFFIDEGGAEHTISLAIDDWFISDFNSYINQQPASLYVEALESSTILQLPYRETEALCDTHPVFERFFRRVAQKAFAYSQRRVLANIGKDAEGRFREFQDMYPSIVQRVPQYALASYLGMTPEFLSKVRKKMAKG